MGLVCPIRTAINVARILYTSDLLSFSVLHFRRRRRQQRRGRRTKAFGTKGRVLTKHQQIAALSPSGGQGLPSNPKCSVLDLLFVTAVGSSTVARYGLYVNICKSVQYKRTSVLKIVVIAVTKVRVNHKNGRISARQKVSSRRNWVDIC